MTRARVARALLTRLRGAGDEDGAVIVIVAGMLVCMLAFAAYAIDTGQWGQVHTHAQSGADAAALAAADTLAGCTDTTTNCDQSATNAATTLAQQNGVPYNATCTAGQTGICVTAPYNSSPYEAKVVEVTRGGGTFGGLLGTSNPLESLSSIANGVRTTSTTRTPTTQTVTTSTTQTISTTATSTSTNVTTTPGISSVVFAGSTSCGALNLANLNGVTIDGLTTNGGWTAGGSNNSTVNALQYDSATCSAPSGSGLTVKSTSADNGTLAYPIDLRQSSQTISCPNTNSLDSNGNSGPAGTVAESQSGGSDTYTDSVSYLKFQNSENVSGIYCANEIDLTNSATLTSTGPTLFIANNFGGGGISDTGTLTANTSGPYKSVLLWMTGTGTQQINSTSFLNGNTIFAPIGGIYLNSNALTGGTQSFFIETSTFQSAGANNGHWEVPSSLASATTTTSTTTTVVPSTTKTVGSTTTVTTGTSTSTSTGVGPSALTG